MARLTQWLMALAGLLTSASMSSCSRGNENEEPRPPVDTEQRVATPEKDGGVDNLPPADDASADENLIDWSLFDALMEAEKAADSKAADSNDVSKVQGAFYGVPTAYKSKSKSGPIIRALRPEVTDGLDTRIIQKVVRSHFREIRACLDNEFERNKNMGSGRVIVSWIINKAGTVPGVAIKETELHNKRFEDCLVKAISSWRFPKYGKSTHVEYPFVFESPTDD